MTITSFDNDLPHHFYKEKTLHGRLMIFLRYVACKVTKRDLTKNQLEKITFMAHVDDKVNGEMYYEGNFVGHIKLIPMTMDFIFKQ